MTAVVGVAGAGIVVVPLVVIGGAAWVAWTYVNRFGRTHAGRIAVGALSLQVLVVVTAIGIAWSASNDYVAVCVNGDNRRLAPLVVGLGFATALLGGVGFAATLVATRRAAFVLVMFPVAVLPYVAFAAAYAPGLGC